MSTLQHKLLMWHRLVRVCLIFFLSLSYFIPHYLSLCRLTWNQRGRCMLLLTYQDLPVKVRTVLWSSAGSAMYVTQSSRSHLSLVKSCCVTVAGAFSVKWWWWCCITRQKLSQLMLHSYLLLIELQKTSVATCRSIKTPCMCAKSFYIFAACFINKLDQKIQISSYNKYWRY